MATTLSPFFTPAPPGIPTVGGPLGGHAPVRTTAGAPPTLPPPPMPNWAVRAAEISREYVAGGGWSFLNAYIRSLPQWIDDASRDFGDDIYDQMMTDPQCNSGIRLLKLAVLANGIRLDPAIEVEPMEEPYETEDIDLTTPEAVKNPAPPGGQAQAGQQPAQPGAAPAPPPPKVKKDPVEEARRLRQHEEAAFAAEVAQFCQDNLLHLERPFVDVLFEMLDALAVGNKVAEKVFELREDLEHAGQVRMYLKALKVKPRRQYSFVVDPFLNIVGIMALIPGQAYPVTTGSIITSPNQVPNMLPREKFSIFTWQASAGDPRGNSLLRPPYNAWMLKRMVWGEYAKYLSQFAGPSLIGYTAPGAQPAPPTDSLGNPIPGAPLITPEQAMLNALLAFKNGTAAVFTGGSKVEPINMSGNGGAFLNAIKLFDQQIAKAILCQTLATEEGEHQARAAAEAHQDILDMVVLHIKALLAAMIYRDILVPLVRYNWGEEAARKYTPKVHLAEIERHNWSQDAAAVASLVTAQFLDPSQYPEMDARLGLPRRKPSATPPPGGAPGAPPQAGAQPGFGAGRPPKPAGVPRPTPPGGAAGPGGNGAGGGQSGGGSPWTAAGAGNTSNNGGMSRRGGGFGVSVGGGGFG